MDKTRMQQRTSEGSNICHFHLSNVHSRVVVRSGQHVVIWIAPNGLRFFPDFIIAFYITG